METFADSISHLSFDGQALRIEFGITRMDDVKQGAPMSGRRLPACRLVLPPAAAVELINRMQQIAAALTQAGVLRQNPPTGRRRDPPIAAKRLISAISATGNHIKKSLYMHCGAGPGLL